MTPRWILCRQNRNISTHILARRMTSFYHRWICIYSISTHILTRRMTSYICNRCTLSIFQLTSSQGGWPQQLRISVRLAYFNSHPHKEDDVVRGQGQKTRWISTHILTRRMTAILNKNNLFKITYYINNKHFISIVDIFFHFHIYF